MPKIITLQGSISQKYNEIWLYTIPEWLRFKIDITDKC